jgi:hypothetical protein
MFFVLSYFQIKTFLSETKFLLNMWHLINKSPNLLSHLTLDINIYKTQTRKTKMIFDKSQDSHQLFNQANSENKKMNLLKLKMKRKLRHVGQLDHQAQQQCVDQEKLSFIGYLCRRSIKKSKLGQFPKQQQKPNSLFLTYEIIFFQEYAKSIAATTINTVTPVTTTASPKTASKVILKKKLRLNKRTAKLSKNFLSSTITDENHNDEFLTTMPVHTIFEPATNTDTNNFITANLNLNNYFLNYNVNFQEFGEFKVWYV